MLNRFKGFTKVFSNLSYHSRLSFKFSSTEDLNKPELPETNESSENENAKKPKLSPHKHREPPARLRNAAIVLSGTGVYDGTEVTEAVSFFIALNTRRIKFQCYAPDKDQTDVINHLTGESQDEKRNVLIESARIARGKVKDIKELHPDKYDVVFFPGGFGAAKNLSDYASKKAELTVDPEVERVLKEFHACRKPIGLACISPILAAKVFGGQPRKLMLTVGSRGEDWPYQDTIDVIEQLGCKHVEKNIMQCYSDIRSLVFTTPAFMKKTSNFHEVFLSIDNLVGSIQKRLEERKGFEIELKTK